MKNLLLCSLFFLFFIPLSAQETFPVNGPTDVVYQCDAFVNVNIFIDFQTRVEQATLVIRNGKVEAAGKGISIPREARVHDMKGCLIYPAFIDLYTSYGINRNTEKAPRNGQQFLSNKKGAFSWNESIRAEFNAADYFTYDDKRAAQLRESGFGAVVSGVQDGICRGTAALVYTGNSREHELIINPQIASGFSFSKGTSSQDYPSSLMGSIALLRQTYYDSRWYKNQNKEKNLSLDAFAKLQTLPAIFAAENKLNILRADKIGDEFAQQYIIKGSGDEYQRMAEIRETKASLIIPVNFPKAYEVEDPFDAEQISTADMKHWELAPSNLYFLSQNNLEFAITSAGCESATDFLQNLRKAVKQGLPEKDALKALTFTPAKLIRYENQLGALRPGMLANFIICTGNIFDKNQEILELWSGGKCSYKNDKKDLKILGKYKISLKGYEGNTIVASGDNKSVRYALQTSDTISVQVKTEHDFFTLLFKPDKKSEDLVSIVAWPETIDSSAYPYLAKNIRGKASFPDGTKENFSASWYDSVPASAKKEDSTIINTLAITYPFVDYGWAKEPEQQTVVFRNATVWTSEADGILAETDVAIQSGRITAIGKSLNLSGAREINAKGKHLTAGIIDEHSHIGISNGVNEGTQAITSEVRIGDVINSEDINIYRQLAGGVTGCQQLHGSANPIGGQSAIIKLRWGASPEKMKIEKADGFIKFALGENVKQSNWGDQATVRYPQTRMGVEQVLYDGFTRAREYEARLKKDPATRRDLELDALSEILNKKRFITCHSYVQSEINMLMHVADSFGFRVNTFTHILEGYKVADKMKARGANASTFADWWAYKYEVVEAIPYNAAILTKVGVNTAINSDDAEMGRRLNQEAAKTVKYGGLTEEEAWKMVTINPAKMLHLDQRMGSIKTGKDADLVLWSDNPLSIYTKPEYTFVDGRCLFSAEQDVVLQEEIRKERQRLIQKMITAKQKGEKTEKKISKEEENYHCED